MGTEMTAFLRRLAAYLLFGLLAGLALAAGAQALTPDISTGKIAPRSDRIHVVEVGFLATDLERMWEKTIEERAGVGLSPPGVPVEEIAKFVANRVAMRDETALHGEGGEGRRRPVEPGKRALRHVLKLHDNDGGKVFYDATKLLATQGSKGRRLVQLLGENADEQRWRPPVSARGRRSRLLRNKLWPSSTLNRRPHRLRG